MRCTSNNMVVALLRGLPNEDSDMNIQPIDAKSVTDKLLLSTLKVSSWSAKTVDKRATQHVLRTENAKNGSGRFDKMLLPGSKLLAGIHKQSTKIRAFYYENTLPWLIVEKGVGKRLLPSANYMSFQQKLDVMRLEWRRRVDDFLSAYDHQISNAQISLGGLFSDDDYPAVEEVDAKFKVVFSVEPLPQTDFWVTSVDSELSSMQEDLEERMQVALDKSNRALWSRLYEQVKHMADKLGDVDGIFRDSLVENLSGICDLMPAMNFADDKRLEQLSNEVRDSLAGLSPDSLRKDSSKREAAALKAKQLSDKMGAFMGGVQ